MLLKKLTINFNFNYRFCTGPFTTLNQSKPTGKLTILPTPIGNLQDLSPNIIKALFKADVIGCQDRRVSGKLYTLIRSRNIMQKMTEQFGEIGLNSLIKHQLNENMQKTQQQEKYLFYNYSNMNQKGRRKFLRKMTKQQQQKFKIDFLKYRALKIMNNQDQLMNKQKQDKYDELYGIDSTDLQHIQLQIKNTRIKKGRGILIPLNTYSQTKMFNMVRMFLQSKNVAIVSDAGMPCISDPGWKMVRKIRQTHPQIPIQVIGGPSSVSVMTLLASLSSKQNSNTISGRFQGFAPEQISNMTDKSVQVQQAKKQQFSIHFINSKKLRKKALQIQKVYGQNQNILLANELTKLYQRKYHGKIRDLNSQMSKEDSQFQGIGQLSYLVYPSKEVDQKERLQNNQLSQNNIDKVDQEIQKINLPRLSLISIHNFIDSIKSAQQQKNKHNHNKLTEQNKKVTSKDLIQIVCTIFGIKTSQARKIIYEKQIQLKNKISGKNTQNKNIFDTYKKELEKQKQVQDELKQNIRRGRRVSNKKKDESHITPQQEMFLKELEKQGNMF